MAQKKAFVRYAQNKAVPGSLIVRTKAPKVGTWKEVPYDICCGGDGKVKQNLIFEVPRNNVVGATLIIKCYTDPPWQNLLYSSGPPLPQTTLNTATDAFNWLTTNFNFPGFSWVLTSPTTIEAVLDSSLVTGFCNPPDEIYIDWQTS